MVPNEMHLGRCILKLIHPQAFVSLTRYTSQDINNSFKDSFLLSYESSSYFLLKLPFSNTVKGLNKESALFCLCHTVNVCAALHWFKVATPNPPPPLWLLHFNLLRRNKNLRLTFGQKPAWSSISKNISVLKQKKKRAYKQAECLFSLITRQPKVSVPALHWLYGRSER